MKPKNDRTQPGQARPTETPARPRRFRIDKLEERIAPKGTNNLGTKHCDSYNHCTLTCS